MRRKGYTSEETMFTDLYEKTGLSIREISRLVDKPYGTVKYRLSMHGFKLRGRGGANNYRKDG